MKSTEIINVSNILVGVENHTSFGCAASLVTDTLVSVAVLAVVFTAGNLSTVMYVYKVVHLKLIAQPTTMLETFIITLYYY
jgi:H2-forming N5,N10-methylenetetrahydromethanopterin dehydrogenase-like enzyme